MKIPLPSKFKPLFKPKRFKVFFGGRGGAKTVSFSKILLSMGYKHKKRVLCLREFMNSIDDSVHSSLSAEVDTLSLQNFYQVKDTKIVGANGTLFRYAGLARNISSIKSKHDFDIAWLEEAETISRKSLDVLIPTIRNAGSELWISFNPDKETAAVYEDFVTPYLDEINKNGFYEDNRIVVVKVNLPDNPFAPVELIEDSAALKEKNHKKWCHIYGGECGGNYDDPIFDPMWFQSYNVLPDYEYTAIFADTALKDGQHNDYTVFQCWAKHRGRIYLVDQYRGKLKAVDLKKKLTEFWSKHKSMSSNAQPLRALYIEDKASGIQLIQDIQNKGGIPVIPIPRPPGSGKVFRANNFAPWIESGLVYLPNNASWCYDYKIEFENFSNDDSHDHDDQIDPTLDAIEKMLVINESIKPPDKNIPKKTIAPTKGERVW